MITKKLQACGKSWLIKSLTVRRPTIGFQNNDSREPFGSREYLFALFLRLKPHDTQYCDPQMNSKYRAQFPNHDFTAKTLTNHAGKVSSGLALRNILYGNFQRIFRNGTRQLPGADRLGRA